MTQEQINLVLAITALLGVFSPMIMKFLDKAFSRGKDKVEYSSDLLELVNSTTEALRKSREDLSKSQEEYDKTVEAMRQGHDASLEAIRVELNGRINRQKARIEDLENIRRVYTITFDLVTHPNAEIRNMQVKPMDDVSASQKMKAIVIEESKEKK